MTLPFTRSALADLRADLYWLRSALGEARHEAGCAYRSTRFVFSAICADLGLMLAAMILMGRKAFLATLAHPTTRKVGKRSWLTLGVILLPFLAVWEMLKEAAGVLHPREFDGLGRYIAHAWRNA